MAVALLGLGLLRCVVVLFRSNRKWVHGAGAVLAPATVLYYLFSTYAFLRYGIEWGDGSSMSAVRAAFVEKLLVTVWYGISALAFRRSVQAPSSRPPSS